MQRTDVVELVGVGVKRTGDLRPDELVDSSQPDLASGGSVVYTDVQAER